jgi:hypothetical protein
VKNLETAAAGVRRVEGIQHLKVFENLPQGVRARVFLKDFRVGKSSKGFEAFKVEGRKETKYLKFEEGIATSDRRRTSSQRKRRTVEFSGGEFAKSREPSDLTEKQGSYGESVERF